MLQHKNIQYVVVARVTVSYLLAPACTQYTLLYNVLLLQLLTTCAIKFVPPPFLLLIPFPLLVFTPLDN